MSRRRFVAIGAAVALALPVSALAYPPKPAPSRYATDNYEVTFAVPPRVTYCRLPDDWVGSDHGTTLFLTPPSACGGAGFPSISRGYEPASTPRFEVYYGYELDSEEGPPAACHAIGTARLLGRLRRLCEGRQDGMITVDIAGGYEADEPAEFALRLETTSRRLPADLRTLKTLAASVRACAASWDQPRGRRACPAGVTWF